MDSIVKVANLTELKEKIACQEVVVEVIYALSTRHRFIRSSVETIMSHFPGNQCLIVLQPEGTLKVVRYY